MDINVSVTAAIRTQVTALTSCFSLLGVLLQIFHRQTISEVRFSKCCRRTPWLLRRQEQKQRLTFPLHYLIKNALESAISTPLLVTHQVTSTKGITESCQGADLQQNNTVLVKQEPLPLTTIITPDQFPGRQSNQGISLIRGFHEGFICSCLTRRVYCQPSSGMFERLRNNRFQEQQFRRTSASKGPDPAIKSRRATLYSYKPLVIEVKLCTRDSSCPCAPRY